MVVDSLPYRGFSFQVKIIGLSNLGFSDVDGLSSEIELEEYEEVTNPFFTTKAPKRYKTVPLVLRRGKNGNTDLLDWVRAAGGRAASGPQFGQATQPRDINTTGNFKRDGFVYLVDPRNRGIGPAWKFFRALPGKYETTALAAGQSGLVFETLELFHEGLEPYDLSKQALPT